MPPHDHPFAVDRRGVLTGITAAGVLALPGLYATAARGQGAQGPVWRSSDFPSFGHAVAQWSETGGTLVVDSNHLEPRPITMTCVPGRQYRLTSDGSRTIAYGGPHFHWLFCILSRGENPFVVDGDLTFDGRNNCNIPFFARFEYVGGAARRNFEASGLTVRNARMKHGRSPIDGSPTNAYGATGMLFGGGFDHLILRRVQAHGVTREAGAGLKGSQGCVGISVSAVLDTTRSPRHVLIEDFEIAHIDSDDPVGSPARGEMDGLLVFQSAEATGSRPVIQRGTIREAAGRAIKIFAPGGGGVTRDLTIHRSVHGNTGGSNDVAHQHGDGLIENITINYSGNAHSQPTVPIGMSSGTDRARGFPFSRGIVRNVRINDTTGVAKRAIFINFYNQRDSAPRSYVLEKIVDSGTAQYLFLPGALGAFGPADISLADVSVNLTTGLFASDDRAQQLRVEARGVSNRNRRAVPFKAFLDGRAAPPGQGGRFVVAGSVTGIAD